MSQRYHYTKCCTQLPLNPEANQPNSEVSNHPTQTHAKPITNINFRTLPCTLTTRCYHRATNANILKNTNHLPSQYLKMETVNNRYKVHTCPICIEDFTQFHNVTILNPCKHVLCSDPCYKKLLSTWENDPTAPAMMPCPVCTSPVAEYDPIKFYKYIDLTEPTSPTTPTPVPDSTVSEATDSDRAIATVLFNEPSPYLADTASSAAAARLNVPTNVNDTLSDDSDDDASLSPRELQAWYDRNPLCLPVNRPDDAFMTQAIHRLVDQRRRLQDSPRDTEEIISTVNATISALQRHPLGPMNNSVKEQIRKTDQALDAFYGCTIHPSLTASATTAASYGAADLQSFVDASPARNVTPPTPEEAVDHTPPTTSVASLPNPNHTVHPGAPRRHGRTTTRVGTPYRPGTLSAAVTHRGIKRSITFENDVLAWIDNQPTANREEAKFKEAAMRAVRDHAKRSRASDLHYLYMQENTTHGIPDP